MKLSQAIAEASDTLDRRDAAALLSAILDRDRAFLLARPEHELSDDEAARFRAVVTRRANGEPLQYILGRQEFFGLDLRVTPEVLIPRPETEGLVEAVLGWVAERKRAINHPLRLIDVGTGSGAIALALTSQLEEAELTAIDLSPSALAVAEANAIRLGLANRVRFLQSDLLSALGTEFAAGFVPDAVISNPPYVPTGDAATLQREVRDFEPHPALFAGEDGLAVYRRLIPQAAEALPPGGLLAMEFGFGQRAPLGAMLTGWREVRFLSDLAGIPRVVLAERA